MSGAVAPLGGHDGGDLPLLQPGEQPPELDAQPRRVVERGEQHLQGVEGDPLGADLVDRRPEADEQRLEVVVPGHVDLLALDLDVVDDQLALGAQGCRGPSRGEATLVVSSSAVSSNATKTPGSPRSMPRTMNSAASRVLPHPGPPATSVVRPRGSPPEVIWSSPSTPGWTML